MQITSTSGTANPEMEILFPEQPFRKSTLYLWNTYSGSYKVYFQNGHSETQ